MPSRRRIAVLEAADEARVRGVLSELSSEYLAITPERLNPELWQGAAGVALAHLALASIAHEDAHRRKARRAMAYAVKQVQQGLTNPGLNGLAGVALALREVSGDEGSTSAVDAMLRAFVVATPDLSFDLIHGVSGIGVYALGQTHLASGRSLVRAVIHHLRRTAILHGRGACWWQPEPGRRERRRAFDVGMAHGTAGVVAFLARALERRDPRLPNSEIEALLERSASWLLEHPGKSGRSRFPLSVFDDTDEADVRGGLLWCRGDVGVAFALFAAARATGRAAWRRAAMDVALETAARSVADFDARDACVCHGAAGVAMFFLRAYRATGELRLRDAARHWIKRLLAMRDPRRSWAGYHVLVQSRWRAYPSLLSGAGGIAMTLVEALGGKTPGLDILCAS